MNLNNCASCCFFHNNSFKKFQSQRAIDSAMPILSYLYMSFGLVFTSCELCERVSDAFEEICDVIDQLDWYKYPSDIKQILPMIILNAQAPINIECFGSISCSRLVFKKVSHIQYLYTSTKCNERSIFSGNQ